MQLDSYMEKLEIFSVNLMQVEDIAKEIHMSDAFDNVYELLSNLKNDAFRLVVVGEFSRGKSTFVNALLGRKILPASGKPTTAIISKIVYGDSPKYSIFYKGKEQQQILTKEEFLSIAAPPEVDESDLKSVQENDRQQRMLDAIDHAEISYPLSFCRDNIEIVDTPGTNDLNVGRMEITYNYLDQADACIFVLSATQPLTKSEANFLTERVLSNKIQNIFFVVTHKNVCHGDPNEEKRVRNFIQNNLKKILPKNFELDNRIFLVESLGALSHYKKERGEELTSKEKRRLPKNLEETGFPILENSLGTFLAYDKGKVKINRYVHKAKNILSVMQHDLLMTMEIVSHSADEIRQKAENMKPKFQDAKLRAGKIVRDMKFNFENAGNDIDYKCQIAANSILYNAKAAVDLLDEGMGRNAMQTTIERAITSEKKKFIDDILRDWKNIFDQENARISDELKNIWNDIDLEYSREFKLPKKITNIQSLSLDDIKLPGIKSITPSTKNPKNVVK